MNDYYRQPGTNCFSPLTLLLISPLLRTCALLILLCSSISAYASPEQAWKKGNDFYQQKQYDSAAFYFEQIAATRPTDATVFYNLGNSYYRLNKIAPAVLNYLRALKRKPDYKEAAENLLLTQGRIPGNIAPAEDIFFVRWWHALTAPGLITLWSVLSLLFFALMIGLLLYRRLQKGKVFIRPQLIGGACLLWLLTLFFTLCAARTALKDTQAVVMQPETLLLAAPGSTGKPLSQLAEGITVKVGTTSGSWSQVTLPDGRTGWVSSNTITVVD